MTQFDGLNRESLSERLESLMTKYRDIQSRGLKLDMSRGKPCAEQLDLSNGMMDVLTSRDEIRLRDGLDSRNYGGIDGISEAKELFSDVLDVHQKELLIGGNSSLCMMHDTLVRAMLFGVFGSDVPWSRLPKVKFLCPSPGYDRHFAICDALGIEMIPVNMLQDGPDMDTVERLVREDQSIKGIWCVPKYSNPEGITFSDDVVDRLASMETKAPDFRIMWDDAYTVHHLTDVPDRLKDILKACKAVGNENRVFIFTSTSKVTFAGSGVAVMAASERNVEQIRKQLSVQTIGPDKLNQLRHVRFLKDKDGIEQHMKKHAAIIKPKFDTVLRILESELGELNIASWSKPNGGYFISLNTLDGCAKAVVNMAAEAGVVLTKAGATYPYGKDPRDRNIRIAPTFPPMEELEEAIQVLCLCLQIVSIKQLLQR